MTADTDIEDGAAAGPWAEVAARLAELVGQQAEFHRRSAHRESVIDHLHDENQRLKAGHRRAILEPVVVDLLRVHESMLRESQRVVEAEPRASKILASYADELAMVLERCGFTTFDAEPDEAFQPGRHTAAGTEPTDDPARHNTVASQVAVGWLEAETQRVRRPVRARFWQYREPAPSSLAAGSAVPESE